MVCTKKNIRCAKSFECTKCLVILCRDIITIDKATGRISKLGRSFTRARDYDAMGPTVSDHPPVCVVILYFCGTDQVCPMS